MCWLGAKAQPINHNGVLQLMEIGFSVYLEIVAIGAGAVAQQ